MFDLIGKTVGPYRIIEQIGAGGMATVYKAYQPNMDRYIAVKVLPFQLSKDPEFAKRFQREARAIARLEHSHILPVFDYGEYEGITYIAMRYIKAGTLKDRMSTGRLSLEEINRLISQIGSALDYAHRMGVIHRDIKPANVLMDDQGDLYLSDFGLARMMEPSQKLTGSGVGLGTPAYMSPEQGQGIKVDNRSDIYSLGIILYEMLTGRVPYEAETPMAVVFKHINGDLPLPHIINPNTPEPVERVILKALAKDPADRYQTVGEMVQALNFAVRMMSAGAEQKIIADKIAPVQQDVSIVTKIQRVWDQPRGKVLLTSGAIVTVLLLGFLLFQLPGNITILAPNATQGKTPVASLGTQATTKESSDQNTSAPVTTTTQSAITASESSTQSINGLYDDFNNPSYDGTFDKTKWAITEDYKGACNTVQQNGYLTITHTSSSSSYSGCFIQGKFDGIAGNKFQSFEAKIFMSNDFQGTCCGSLGMTLASSSFSGGGGWIECSLQLEPGTVSGVFAIKHGQGEKEFFSKLETTFNSWHTLSLQIDQASYTVSCYIDNKLIGSVIPKDAETLKNANFQSYLGAGWPGNSTGTYQLDDVSVSEIQPSTSNVPSLPTPQGKLVFDQNFDSGLATGIVPFDSTKWELTDDSNAGKVFQLDSTGSGWMGFRLGTMTVADGTIEFRVKLVHLGVITCDFRSAPSGSFGYLFALHVDQSVVDLNYFGADTVWHLLNDASAVPYVFTENVWYDVKIDFQGNRITAYLDGKQLLTTSDDQIKSGIITFGVGPNTVAQFDDIRVWAQP